MEMMHIFQIENIPVDFAGPQRLASNVPPLLDHILLHQCNGTGLGTALSEHDDQCIPAIEIPIES